MTRFMKTLAAVAAGTVLATSAFAQSAREIRGADQGGHFPAWEYPELFAAELRAAFRPLRKLESAGRH